MSNSGALNAIEELVSLSAINGVFSESHSVKEQRVVCNRIGSRRTLSTCQCKKSICPRAQSILTRTGTHSIV